MRLGINDCSANEVIHKFSEKYWPKIIYSKIIHNYSDFNVMTIDRFTNTVISAFSSELNLMPSYDIVLEEKEFLNDVVSTFID